MMRHIIFLLVFVSAHTLRADNAATIAAVKEADDARVAAITTVDAKQLDALLSDQLHYAHSVKLIENKAAFIAAFTSGRRVYQTFDYQVRDVSIAAPGVAVMTGQALVKAGSSKTMFLVNINFLAVWRLENGRWRLFAWQSSRNEEITPLDRGSESKTPNQLPEPTSGLAPGRGSS